MSVTEKLPENFTSIISSKDQFSLSELAEILMEESPLDDGELLSLRDWLYQGSDYFFNEGQFFKKSAFFKGSVFLIQLTRDEWEKGFLIPGHRWHPFVSRELRPWDIELLDTQGNTIPREERSTDWEKLKPFHLLLGEEQLFSDCQMKSDLFGRFFAQFPQYDLRDFIGTKTYSETKFLKCQVLDYNRGIIRIEGLVSPNKEESSWQESLEKALNLVFQSKGLSLTLPEQIEWALFLGGKELRKTPRNTLASGIYHNPNLALYRIGLTTLLWKSDGSIDEKLKENELIRNPARLKKESRMMLNELESLFNDLSPFVDQALGSLKSLSVNYIEHFTHCLDDMGNLPLKPMKKESQLFFTLSQYSHCLMNYFRQMTDTPPSWEEKEKLAEMLIETEGLLCQIEPLLKECSTETKP